MKSCPIATRPRGEFLTAEKNTLTMRISHYSASQWRSWSFRTADQLTGTADQLTGNDTGDGGFLPLVFGEKNINGEREKSGN